MKNGYNGHFIAKRVNAVNNAIISKSKEEMDFKAISKRLTKGYRVCR
jgi:hypothetical protein